MKKLTLTQNLKHLYISPLEQCNLNCKICYTAKKKHRLTFAEIKSFILRYKTEIDLKLITFCGGEVFLLDYFNKLLNWLTEINVNAQVITNGTIDRLEEITNPTNISFIVSLDGLPDYHDLNRGEGNFEKSLTFINKGLELGFYVEIFSIVTANNFKEMETFKKYLRKVTGKELNITFIPRKSKAFLKAHPQNGRVGQIENFEFLSKEDTAYLKSKYKTLPPKDYGCYQISLMSDRKIYSCCEGIKPVGTIDSKIKDLVKEMKNRLKLCSLCVTSTTCGGCTEPEYLCGEKCEYSVIKTETT